MSLSQNLRLRLLRGYERRLACMLNVRALSVTVYSRTVIAEHLREEQKDPDTDQMGDMNLGYFSHVVGDFSTIKSGNFE